MQSHRNNPYFCPGHCCESAEWQSKRLIIITMEEQEHVLFIKNMVCNRCILVVSEMLKNLNFNPLRIELGKVVIEEPLKPADRFLIRKALEALGFELVHYENNLSILKLSEYSSERCHYDCSLLSKLFSAGNGISIEKYYIAQKVERIKELLIYDELTIGEIATQLQYSSVAHLSSQFRQVTGMSPSEFKRLKGNKRSPLDKV